MNVGVCVSHKREGMRESFEKIKALGFNHCQLLSWDSSLWTTEQAELIRNTTEELGVTITAFWCGWCGPSMWNFYEGQETLGLVPVAFRFARMQDLMNGADFAHKMGIQDVATHVGFIPENPYDPNYHGLITALKVVGSHLLKNNQYLLFETGQETPVALMRTFADVGTGNLGVNLDPANLVMYGKANPVDAMDMIGQYVRGVHGKDGKYPVNGYSLGDETPLGQGKVNFPRLLLRLKQAGYTGSITIEREIEGEQQTKDILDGKTYLENIIAGLNGGQQDA